MLFVITEQALQVGSCGLRAAGQARVEFRNRITHSCHFTAVHCTMVITVQSISVLSSHVTLQPHYDYLCIVSHQSDITHGARASWLRKNIVATRARTPNDSIGGNVVRPVPTWAAHVELDSKSREVAEHRPDDKLRARQ